MRALLIAFAFAVSAPLMLLLAVLLFRSTTTERAGLEERLLQVASNLTELIERDIDRSIALLQTLATSPAISNNDWPRFYEQARAALRGRAYLVFVDSTGRQLVNTYVRGCASLLFAGELCPVCLPRPRYRIAIEQRIADGELRLGPLDHGLRGTDLRLADGTRGLDIDDDTVLDIDQIVGEIQHAVDLAHHMVGRNDLVEVEGIEQLPLAVVVPPHHRPPPSMTNLKRRIHALRPTSTEFCNKIGPNLPRRS